MPGNLVIANASQIVTPVSREAPQRGISMRGLQVWKDTSMSINTKTGKIIDIGPWRRVRQRGAKVIDAKGYVILPGFVDSHTHPIFAGSRVSEFLLRLQGTSYLEILAQGGGILSTVDSTRNASTKELFGSARQVFQEMLRHGTTTVEAKTGYGLNTEEEIRLLTILQKLKKEVSVDLLITFLGGHAIPRDYATKPDQYVDLICSDMLPRLSRQRLADFCDMFCETGVFSVQQSKRILETAKSFGLKIRMHADEFESNGGAELAVTLNALAADHLMGISDTGIERLAQSDTAAVLLPCTTFFLGKENYAPARTLIDSGGIVAIASDYNAGSNGCFSIQMAASLALLRMKLTPEECVVASTLHGAYALGISNRFGSLYPGKQGDLIFFGAKDYRELFFRFGTNQVSLIVKKGKVVK